MYYVFNKTHIGYSHIRSNKICQDFSASYQDNERIVVTCCDGHGGVQYVRSHLGSKAASEAVMNVFKNIDSKFFREVDGEKNIEKVKLLILCEYNKLIEREIANKPFRKSELKGLDEDQIDVLRFNPAKAYGTTLSGAMVFKNKLIVVSIGDTEVLGVRKGELLKIFDNTNDPAGNVTYSMCQEDAYQYLKVAILNPKDFDAVFLFTDGLSSPFQSYSNLLHSFIRPTVRKVLNSKSTSSADIAVIRLATELGVGDDVSLSFIINNKTKIKYYR